ncbi:MAG: hypothetical protein ACTSV7_06815 [Candidatus Baldrarchaeia archaeon]
MRKIRDFTYYICKDCKHRILRSTPIGLVYVCELGIDRDRSPHYCPFKEK